MQQLNTMALRIDGHARGNETLRVSDLQTMRLVCEGVLTLGVEDGYEERDVRFADLLLAVISRIETGEGVRKAVAF